MFVPFFDLLFVCISFLESIRHVVGGGKRRKGKVLESCCYRCIRPKHPYVNMLLASTCSLTYYHPTTLVHSVQAPQSNAEERLAQVYPHGPGATEGNATLLAGGKRRGLPRVRLAAAVRSGGGGNCARRTYDRTQGSHHGYCQHLQVRNTVWQ